MLSEEPHVDDDHGCADYVSEPDDEQSVDRNYRQDSTDEPHDSLPEVFIVNEEVLTDSSVATENPASSSQEARTLPQ